VFVLFFFFLSVGGPHSLWRSNTITLLAPDHRTARGERAARGGGVAHRGYGSRRGRANTALRPGADAAGNTDAMAIVNAVFPESPSVLLNRSWPASYHIGIAYLLPDRRRLRLRVGRSSACSTVWRSEPTARDLKRIGVSNRSTSALAIAACSMLLTWRQRCWAWACAFTALLLRRDRLVLRPVGASRADVPFCSRTLPL